MMRLRPSWTELQMYIIRLYDPILWNKFHNCYLKSIKYLIDYGLLQLIKNLRHISVI